jgi:hypothetical protein
MRLDKPPPKEKNYAVCGATAMAEEPGVAPSAPSKRPPIAAISVAITDCNQHVPQYAKAKRWLFLRSVRKLSGWRVDRINAPIAILLLGLCAAPLKQGRGSLSVNLGRQCLVALFFLVAGALAEASLTPSSIGNCGGASGNKL